MYDHDPIEDDPQYKEIFEKIYQEVREAVGNVPAIYFWRTKKQILKEEYGLGWKSPGEMNPTVEFD